MRMRRHSGHARGRDGNAPAKRLSGFEGGGRGVDEALRLLLHPFLVVELDVFFVFASGAMRLAYGRRIVRQISVAIIAKIFRHR